MADKQSYRKVGDRIIPEEQYLKEKYQGVSLLDPESFLGRIQTFSDFIVGLFLGGLLLYFFFKIVVFFWILFFGNSTSEYKVDSSSKYSAPLKPAAENCLAADTSCIRN